MSRGITYEQLVESIQCMDEEHKKDNVTIYDPDRDEFYPICGMETAGQMGFVKNNGSGILDDGCIFLVIPTDGIKT